MSSAHIHCERSTNATADTILAVSDQNDLVGRLLIGRSERSIDRGSSAGKRALKELPDDVLRPSLDRRMRAIVERHDDRAIRSLERIA